MIKNISMIRYGSLNLQFGEDLDRKIYKVKKKLGICGESSITWIKTDDNLNILIDTGFKNEINLSKKNLESNRSELRLLLKLKNLKFEDIDEIFITHWHLDHFGNLSLFKNAKIFFAGISSSRMYSILKSLNISNEVKRLKEGEFWHENLSIIHTPGHNRTHHSIILQYDGLNIISAGDAIVSKDYYDQDEIYPYNSDFLSKRVGLKSMNKIREIADIIIPGHDQPFENWKKIKN